MKICWVVLVSLVSCVWTGVEVSAQKIALPDRVASAHPRIVEDHAYTQASMRARIAKDPEAQRAVADAKENLAPYMEHVRADPMWLASRLQMYWESHATDIYNRGDVFDHADGHAPVATVRFSGSRNPNTTYRAPRIEEIPAYEDDRKGVAAE